MRRILSFLLLPALAVTACSSGKRDTTGRPSKGFVVPSYEVLWDVAKKEMGRAGFPADLENSNQEARVLVSRWQTQLMPFGGKGRREQATVTLIPEDGSQTRWSVQANVIRESNMDLKDPSDPGKAEWKNPERVDAKERQIVYGIESFFIGHEVSPRFRTDYDVPEGKGTLTAPGTAAGR
jgi:hypothetical protein